MEKIWVFKSENGVRCKISGSAKLWVVIFKEGTFSQPRWMKNKSKRVSIFGFLCAIFFLLRLISALKTLSFAVIYARITQYLSGKLSWTKKSYDLLPSGKMQPKMDREIHWFIVFLSGQKTILSYHFTIYQLTKTVNKLLWLPKGISKKDIPLN